MDYLTGGLWWIISSIFGLAWWIVTTLLWMLVWFVLPFAVVAFIALRVAESTFGQDAVRAWLKARTMKYGAGVWDRVRRISFALGVLPFRVIAWFVVYAVWHALVSVFWRPKWQPWTRAWGKRWRPAKTTASGRAVKVAAKV